MAITKKLVTDFIKQEIAFAIQEKKCSRKSNHQHPLFAWIQGAHKIQGKSKIHCVADNQTSWPWHTQNAAGYEFLRRLNKKRKLSFLQKTWLSLYVERRFCGVYRDRYSHVCDEFSVPDERKNAVLSASMETTKFISSCMEKAGVNPNDPPLRLILSAQLTIFIHLKFMEYFL